MNGVFGFFFLLLACFLAPAARADGRLSAGSLDGRYQLTRLPSGQDLLMRDLDYERQGGSSSIRIPAHPVPVQAMIFSPDSRHFVTGAQDGSLRLWELMDGGSARLLEESRAHTAAVVSLSFDRDGRRLWSRDARRHRRLWDISTGQLKPQAAPSLSKGRLRIKV